MCAVKCISRIARVAPRLHRHLRQFSTDNKIDRAQQHTNRFCRYDNGVTILSCPPLFIFIEIFFAALYVIEILKKLFN